MQEASVIEYASVTNFLKRYPMFLDLLNCTNWRTTDVGAEFYYSQSVHCSELYAFNGVFMELFLRKCLCKKFNIPCTDERTETQLRNSFRAEDIKEALCRAYASYKNPEVDAVEIIDRIKMVALSHRLVHDEKMENVRDVMSMEVDILNLIEIMKFVDNLQYEKCHVKERCAIQCNNVHLLGVPDYVFDDLVICHVSTSMRHELYPSKAIKVVFYMLGHYSQNYLCQNVEKVYTLIIYNPLLGKTHTLRYRIDPAMFTRIQNLIEEKVRLMPRELDPFLCY